MKNILSLIVAFVLFQVPALAQRNSKNTANVQKPVFSNEIQRLSASLDTFNKILTPEKIFIHTDKSYYTTQDTIWLKAYLLNGLTNKYSSKSGILYAELISDSAEVIRRISLPVSYGLTWGQIFLDPATFPEGTYTLRAYTNWMQNFGDDYFFKKKLYISHVNDQHWLIRQQQNLQGKNMKVGLHIRDLNDKNYAYKKLRLRLQEGKKTLSKVTLESKVDGTIDADFSIPDKTDEPLHLLVESLSDTKQKAVIPIALNRKENIDLQFMPEGGYLVAGLPTKIAFKAVAENGLGTAIEGKIMDSRNTEITVFKSSYKGMGSFDFIPEKGEAYSAKVTLQDGRIITYPLPAVKSSGTVLRTTNTLKNDSIRIIAYLSEDLVNNQTYKIIGTVNGSVHYGSTFTANRQRVSGTISKSHFPSGIAHFILFNENDQPLNERLTFVNHQEDLDITITPAKGVNYTRDSISLQISTNHKRGKAMSGSFSLSVTDDALVKNNVEEENIISNALLTSGLKGNIENPGYYLSDSPDAIKAMELLLLTQGWRGYNWQEIFNPTTEPRFAAEPDFNVTGRVTNILNKPVSKSKVLLMSSGKYRLLRDTVTNENGRFMFANFPPVDTISFFVQARNGRGKSFGIGLEIDEFKPAPVIESKTNTLPSSWYVNTDSTVLNFVKTTNRHTKELGQLTGRNVLETVVITGKKVIKKSKNLNGPGEADQVIDEAQATKAGQISMINFLLDNVKGFNLRPKGEDQFYHINEKRARFIIDGIDLNRFYDPSDPPILNQYYDYINTCLSSISVDEITGVEVMYNMRNTSKYDTEFLTITEQMGSMSVAYLEITTRSGNGAFYRKTPGIANYKPLPLSRPLEFYHPKYTASTINSKVPDTRSTIFWEPHIFSNENGVASVSFYSADKPGTYTLILQGTNLNGLFGYKTMKLKIEQRR